MLRSVVGRAGGGLVRILCGREGRRAPGLRQCHAEHGGFVYREAPPLSRRDSVTGELLMSFMWFWVLWHFWHNTDMLTGHFPYPDASKWTDEELGIPPDVE